MAAHACTRVHTRTGVTLWASFKGKTTSKLFISLTSPSGSVISVDTATPPPPPPPDASANGGANSWKAEEDGEHGRAAVDNGDRGDSGGQGDVIITSSHGDAGGDAAAGKLQRSKSEIRQEEAKERDVLDKIFGTVNVLDYQLSRLLADTHTAARQLDKVSGGSGGGDGGGAESAAAAGDEALADLLQLQQLMSEVAANVAGAHQFAVREAHERDNSGAKPPGDTHAPAACALVHAAGASSLVIADSAVAPGATASLSYGCCY